MLLAGWQKRQSLTTHGKRFRPGVLTLGLLTMQRCVTSAAYGLEAKSCGLLSDCCPTHISPRKTGERSPLSAELLLSLQP
jgi:hypothetical protein